jgi:hypothetical protein
VKTSGDDKVRIVLSGIFPPEHRLDRYRWRQAVDDIAWSDVFGQVLQREMQRFEDDGGRTGS